jgi:hypothetical protein
MVMVNCIEANIDGFSCPDGETLGPNGQPLAHPSFPHPSSCRKYITCYFSTDIKVNRDAHQYPRL